ncbi:MAG: PEP-CTERM sorting domain-containing protein, partial [Burkholderiales bacterium]
LAPSIGQTIVTGFVITTANDAVERDPAGWALYGTNDPIMSTNHSPGDAELWALIDSGLMDLPLARFAAGASVPVDNTDAYSAYRLIFTSVRNGNAANSVQFAEIQFDGRVGDDGASVPEPASWALVLLTLSMLAASRRRTSALRRRN